VFYPIDALPAALQAVSWVLPLTHATELVRPLILGQIPEHAVLNVAVLLAYALAGFYAAMILFRRRLLR
jgi:lipooligosaccharide transport system permease protein